MRAKGPPKCALSSVFSGCSPANRQGRKVRSLVEGDSVVSRGTPKPSHHAFGRFLKGGMISILNMPLQLGEAYSLTLRGDAHVPPPIVTSSIFAGFLKPTPISPLLLEAKVKETGERKVLTESTLKARDEVAARLGGDFRRCGKAIRAPGGDGRRSDLSRPAAALASHILDFLENLRYAIAKKTSATTKRTRPTTTEIASVKTPTIARAAKSISILLTLFLSAGGGVAAKSSLNASQSCFGYIHCQSSGKSLEQITGEAMKSP